MIRERGGGEGKASVQGHPSGNLWDDRGVEVRQETFKHAHHVFNSLNGYQSTRGTVLRLLARLHAGQPVAQRDG
ncbi:hypothetical protein Krac_4281 [Ktedonobacter racemifer DSM 44963]|uniref:Uncharacterized protein n=1 Tax=Ktedonobacter racemifer DSM 44963 TaxID=485913 RepID=D6TSD2_KTERA|nr:hypothetical protein Krac_4281 [Ktedonobacter racemifer DSM 44963]